MELFNFIIIRKLAYGLPFQVAKKYLAAPIPKGSFRNSRWNRDVVTRGIAGFPCDGTAFLLKCIFVLEGCGGIMFPDPPIFDNLL